MIRMRLILVVAMLLLAASCAPVCHTSDMDRDWHCRLAPISIGG